VKSVYVDPQRQKAGQMAEQDTQKVLRKEFLDAMSRAVSSVCVVTTDGPAGRGGVTVSAMTSVSADGDAPTMLVCVNASASAAPLLLENKAFCINMHQYSGAGAKRDFRYLLKPRPCPGWR